MVGQANFSSKELNGINNSELQDKLFAKGINWNNLPTRLKRGSCIIRDIETGNWIEDLNIPIFIEKRGYINQFIPYINYEKIDLNLVF
jgi:tRNA(His) 5'-end guanylyltransferase